MKKVIFIDRDGVINKDPGGWTEYNYVTTWEEFIFLPNSIKALRRLSDAGYDIVVASNQAGISKGYYRRSQLDKLNQNMIKKIEENGAKLKKVYYCFHQDSDKCDCRKPRIGLFKQAERELGVKATGNYFIGDGKTDVEAGNKMNMKTVLVLSGKTDLKEVGSWDVKPDYIFEDLSEAVNFVLNEDTTYGTRKAT